MVPRQFGLFLFFNFFYKQIEFLFYRQTGVDPRVLILVWEESSRDAPWCPTLGMVLTRKLATFFLMGSRNSLCTMPRSWSYWWCITGQLKISLDLDFIECQCVSFGLFINSILFVENQDILCWDCTQCVHKKEEGDCRESCPAGCCCYQQAC